MAVKRILRYLVLTPTLGLWYPKGSTFELVGYSDSDWAGDKVDRKSTSGACQFIGRSLVSWSSKKQNSTALSTAEAEYISAASCCAQLLWMRQTLKDYGVSLGTVPLLCDNESAIKIANNPVQHNRTKHIDIRHHFLRDHVANGDIALTHVGTMDQLADIFTKPLDEARFVALRRELGILKQSETGPAGTAMPSRSTHRWPGSGGKGSPRTTTRPSSATTNCQRSSRTWAGAIGIGRPAIDSRQQHGCRLGDGRIAPGPSACARPTVPPSPRAEARRQPLRERHPRSVGEPVLGEPAATGWSWPSEST